MKRHSILQVALKDRNITYKELARHLNITTTTLSNKINGKYPFTLLEAKQIIDYLGVSNNDDKCKLFNL